jgi:hypothetical protein
MSFYFEALRNVRTDFFFHMPLKWITNIVCKSPIVEKYGDFG